MQNIAENKNCTTAQLALAWVLHQWEKIIPIPGTKRVKYLEENVSATEIKLSEVELKQISDLAPIGFTKGTRYPSRAMNALNR